MWYVNVRLILSVASGLAVRELPWAPLASLPSNESTGAAFEWEVITPLSGDYISQKYGAAGSGSTIERLDLSGVTPPNSTV